MKLTLDFKNAYISPEQEIHDVQACYSKTGIGSGKLIVISHTNARLQTERCRGRSIKNPRDYGVSEKMAENIVRILTGKEALVAPRDRGWQGASLQAFTCEPKKKSFIG